MPERGSPITKNRDRWGVVGGRMGAARRAGKPETDVTGISVARTCSGVARPEQRSEKCGDVLRRKKCEIQQTHASDWEIRGQGGS